MAEDAQYAHDPKYRQFLASVDKALRAFESAGEWADLISALGKLSKALQAHSQFPVLPKKYTVTKRLSQCTHPALPSGCHLKALEVYDLIFQRIGPHGLSADLFIYTSGLFPLLGNAAMSVRPVLLTIYEQHFLKLGRQLLPALQGLLLALLPGMEEGSEHTDRIFSLLVTFSKKTELLTFYSALWRCILTVPNVRLPALSFVLSQLNKKQTAEDQLFIIGDDLTTMLHAMCAALGDEIILVQRSALDLLVQLLPFHEHFLLRLDVVLIVQSALGVLLRRDMSLSRRLHSWFMGSGAHGKSDDSRVRREEYFAKHALPYTVRAIRKMLDTSVAEDIARTKMLDSAHPSHLLVLRPLRMLITLMDKAEVGPQIIDDIMLDVVHALCSIYKVADKVTPVGLVRRTLSQDSISESQSRQTNALEEIHRTAKMFFEQLEPGYIWEYFALCFSRFEKEGPALRDTEAGSTVGMHQSNRMTLPQGGEQSKGSSPVPSSSAEDVLSKAFDDLAELSSFMLSFLPLDMLLELHATSLPLVFCHVLRAIRCHCDVLSPGSIKRGLTLCSQLLGRTSPGSKAVFTPPHLWPDIPVGPDQQNDISAMVKEEACHREEQKEADNESHVLMTEVCVHYAKSCFAELISKRVLPCFVSDGSSFTSPALSSLLEAARRRNSFVAPLPKCNSDSLEIAALDNVFICGSHLLLELASVAMILQPDGLDESEQSAPPGKATGWNTGQGSSISPYTHEKSAMQPKWLDYLLHCSVAAPTFSIGASAVRCLIELCDASKAAGQQPPCRSSSENEGIIQFTTLLNIDEVAIVQRLCIFEVLARLLWKELGSCNAQYHTQLAELLCRLNGCSAAIGVLEKIICSEFSDPDPMVSLSAHQRFTQLWYLSYEEHDAKDVVHLDRAKLFTRPLNLMLDSLTSSQPSSRVLAHGWLQQALCSGDIHRILQPLLLALLQPSTARIRQTFTCQRVETASPTVGMSTLQPTYTRLVYTRLHDTAVSIYALRCLLNIARAQPQLFVCMAATCRLPTGGFGPNAPALDELLARHENSMAGEAFETPVSLSLQSPRNYLEVLLSVVLWLMVTTYPPQLKPSADAYADVAILQVTSAELLTALLRACVHSIASGQSSTIGSFFRALLGMCNFHRTYLFCLINTLVPAANDTSIEPAVLASLPSGQHQRVRKESISAAQEAFQAQLLELAEVTLELEHVCQTMVPGELQDSTAVLCSPTGPEPASVAEVLEQHGPIGLLALVATLTQPLSRLALQPLFQQAMALALKSREMVSMHARWLQLLSRSVVWLGPTLRSVVLSVTTHLCGWLQRLAKLAHGGKDMELPSRVPALYVPSLLDGLGALIHYCLLGKLPTTLPTTTSVVTLPESGSGHAMHTHAHSPSTPVSGGTGWLDFKSLLTFGAGGGSSVGTSNKAEPELSGDVVSARDSLLTMLVPVVDVLVDIWMVWRCADDEEEDKRVTLPPTWGAQEHVCTQVVGVLQPISQSYGAQLLSAFAEIWAKEQSGRSVLVLTQLNQVSMVSTLTHRQQDMIVLITQLKGFALDTLLSTSRALLLSKELPGPTEECLMHLLHSRLSKSSALELQQCWPVFLPLLRDGIPFGASHPPRLFLTIALLERYVRPLIGQDDRKVKKELLDVCQRLLEACNSVVAASLENTAWLRRSMAIATTTAEAGAVVATEESSTLPEPVCHENGLSMVKATSNGGIDSGTEGSLSDSSADKTLTPRSSTPAKQTDTSDSGTVSTVSSAARKGSSRLSVYSPQALCCLAKVLSGFVDGVFGSEEKEKVVLLLSGIVVNLLPFFRAKRGQMVLSCKAAVQLLMSVSEFHYTRRAWRREVMDLFFENNFFQMDLSQVSSWSSIIDNLFGHDKTARRDLLGRIIIFQSGLNLFTNSDTEMMQRARMLKRLCFAIFSSPVDQYQPFLPEIQERLSECLRIEMAPPVHVQVFLCWRILLVRMSANHLTAFWPVIISELIQVLLQMEQDLIVQCRQYIRGKRKQSNKEERRQDPWLSLYLASCKLLDLVLALPPSSLPQFQLYQWAFVGEQTQRRRLVGSPTTIVPPDFDPYLVRMADILDQEGLPDCEVPKVTPGRPLLQLDSLSSLVDLKPFILGLVHAYQRTVTTVIQPRKRQHKLHNPTNSMTSEEFVDYLIAKDFLESPE